MQSFYNYIVCNKNSDLNSDKEQKSKAQELHTMVESNKKVFWKNGASLIKPLLAKNTEAIAKVLEKLEFHVFILEEKEKPIEIRDVDNIRLYYNDFGGYDEILHLYYLPDEEKKISKQEQRETVLETLIDKVGKDELIPLKQIGVWKKLTEIDSTLFPLREKKESMVKAFFKNQKLIKWVEG